jgi:GrpB-like predicted nucleotidyltransferase (UPF0157 family)
MTTSNELHEMTLEKLGQLFPILLHDHSDAWSSLYQSESKLIQSSFSQTDIIRIDHIGSTAIPGIKAKPTIDILLQVSEYITINTIKKIFLSLDYHINERPDNPPPHLTFVKGYTPQGVKGQTYHVHIRYKGDWDELRFRDYLINHKETAKEYEALKLNLADRYRNDREAYTNSKTGFINNINILTRLDCMDNSRYKQ